MVAPFWAVMAVVLTFTDSMQNDLALRGDHCLSASGASWIALPRQGRRHLRNHHDIPKTPQFIFREADCPYVCDLIRLLLPLCLA